MNKYLRIWHLLFFLPISLFSQNSLDNVLLQIEKNNTTLAALRLRVDADKLENKTGIYLQNPEFAFNYLWGNPSIIGNRTDISIVQTFDFPTVYSFKSQISEIKNQQVELEYQSQRKSVLLEARLICCDLIYLNAMKSEFSKRLINAQSIANSYKSKFDVGEANILEYNKSKLYLLNLNKEVNMLDIQRDVLLGDLCRLNGGLPIDYLEAKLPIADFPFDFEQWYKLAELSNPLFVWLIKEVEKNKKQISLTTAMSYPKIHAGFMSESVTGQQFQGVTVGLSIPLWENKNSIKLAKANYVALESLIMDKKMQFYNNLKTLHAKTVSLQKTVNDYRTMLQTMDNSVLLKVALEKGEISIIQYIMELTLYYESVNKMLEMEKEMNKSIAILNQYK